MPTPMPFVLAALIAAAACGTTSPVTAPGGQSPGAPTPSAAKGDEPSKRQKELESKRQELAYAQTAVEVAAIEQQVRQLTVENGLAKAQFALAKAKKDLELFAAEQKPRELEQQRMRLDQQAHRAEESKEELAELEGMYNQDQFAAATKELVIKRGRRAMEMADRGLAIGKAEFKTFEQHTLVEREKDLQRKVEDAAVDLKKAELEIKKSQIESASKQAQAADKVKGLQRDIAELEKKQ